MDWNNGWGAYGFEFERHFEWDTYKFKMEVAVEGGGVRGQGANLSEEEIIIISRAEVDV